jgi:hypothetical protein
MTPPNRTARILGGLLLIQLAGLIVPFALLHPMTQPDFLETAAAHSAQVRAAVLLLLWNCGLTIGISVIAWPLFRQHSEPGALLLVATSLIMFTLQAVDNAHLLSMLSLSQQFAAGNSQGELLQAMAAAVGSTRRWVHYSALFSIDAWIFVLYSLLYRFRVVPRAVAVFGLATVILHFSAIVLPTFLGYSSVMPLGVPMAVSHIALVLWLTIKGSSEAPSAAAIHRAGVEAGRA